MYNIIQFNNLYDINIYSNNSIKKLKYNNTSKINKVFGKENIMTKKGTLEERTVVQIFEDNGYASVRIPASGGATKRDRPDVIAGNRRNYYAIEVKSSKKNSIYIRKEQVEELERFCVKFGAKPLICVKFTRKPYIILQTYHLLRTKSGNYKIDNSVLEKGILLEKFVKTI